MEFGLRGRTHRRALQPQAFERETRERLRQRSRQGGVEGEVQRLEVGETAQWGGQAPAQVVVLEVQFGHALVRIGSHAVPFAQRCGTQPVCLVRPVGSIGLVVERRQRVPLRIPTISNAARLAARVNVAEPFLEFDDPKHAYLSFSNVEYFERETGDCLRQRSRQVGVAKE